MRNRAYVVVRDSVEETTVAIIKAKVKDEIAYTADFLEALKKAVTKWSKTKIGAAAVAESCNDFNVGDLSGWEKSCELTRFLKEEGIAQMNITIVSNCDDRGVWTFDEHLVNDEDESTEDEEPLDE